MLSFPFNTFPHTILHDPYSTQQRNDIRVLRSTLFRWLTLTQDPTTRLISQKKKELRKLIFSPYIAIHASSPSLTTHLSIIIQLTSRLASGRPITASGHPPIQTRPHAAQGRPRVALIINIYAYPHEYDPRDPPDPSPTTIKYLISLFSPTSSLFIATSHFKIIVRHPQKVPGTAPNADTQPALLLWNLPGHT
jgi:hypothetical protein